MISCELMKNLLLLLVTSLLVVALLGGLGALSPDTARTSATKGRGEGEVDVLLRVETDDERRHVDDLLADADVALADQHTRVVDRLGQAELVDAGLETALEEILDLEGQHVIELHAVLVEHTDTHQTANEGVTFEETLGVLLVHGQELTSGTTDLGEGELHTPHLTLVAQTIFTDSLQLGVKTSGLEGSTRDLVGLGV